MKSLMYFLSFVLVITSFSCGNKGKRDQEGKLLNQQENTNVHKSINNQRYGMVIGLKPDKVKEYKELHENAWPGVLKQLKESNIQNYTIFLHHIEGKNYLFSYFEYIGNDYERDMEKMAADSVTQEWWKLTDSYQVPLDSRQKGEWWAIMEEVFHHE